MLATLSALTLGRLRAVTALRPGCSQSRPLLSSFIKRGCRCRWCTLMLGVLQAPRAESEEPSLLHPNDHLLHVGRVFLAWFFLCLDAFSEQERRRTGFDEFLRLVVSCLIVRFYPGVGRKDSCVCSYGRRATRRWWRRLGSNGGRAFSISIARCNSVTLARASHETTM